jgi:hypothetical protein
LSLGSVLLTTGSESMWVWQQRREQDSCLALLRFRQLHLGFCL